MLRTNRDSLVKISVIGEVVSPIIGDSVYKISADGEPVILPGVGGITYNIRVGDRACGWMADHVEPGVSIENRVKDARFPRGQSRALNVLSCIGNEAKVVSGDAKGKIGTVVGKHGGIEHVIIDFKPEIMESLVIEDRVMVKAFGVGLRLLDLPQVKLFNLDPDLLYVVNPKIKNGYLQVPVTHVIPACLMGSGLGQSHAASGDYDITMFCEATADECGLDDVCFGDLVAIRDADHSFGRIFRKGSMSVGVITHSDCVLAGHGPGVTTLFTSRAGNIEPLIDPNANIAKILEL